MSNPVDSQNTSSDAILHETESPVRRAIVAICEKCGKKIAAESGDPDASPSRDIQKKLKTEFAEAFGRGEVRPVVSSCLDVCPQGEITVGIFRTDAQQPSHQFFTFAPEDTANLAGALKKKLNSSGPSSGPSSGE